MATTITQKDTTLTKIFVGGLPYHTTDKSLREFFDKFGDIEEAVVITDRQTGKSRGYGFVTMSNKEGAERACKEPNPIIDGRKANVNLAYLGAKPRGIATGLSLSGIPIAIKTGLPSAVPVSYAGVPQYIYPSTAYVAGTTPNVLASSLTSPISPTAAGQYIDYSAYAAQFAAAGAYEAAYPYGTTASAFVTPSGAAYTAYAMPQQIAAGTPTIHFQPQQIPADRMQ